MTVYVQNQSEPSNNILHFFLFDQGFHNCQSGLQPKFSGLHTRTNLSQLAVLSIFINAFGCYDFVSINIRNSAPSTMTIDREKLIQSPKPPPKVAFNPQHSLIAPSSKHNNNENFFLARKRQLKGFLGVFSFVKAPNYFGIALRLIEFIMATVTSKWEILSNFVAFLD